MPSYPGSVYARPDPIPSLRSTVPTLSTILGQYGDEIELVESTLGTNPHTPFATVDARLDASWGEKGYASITANILNFTTVSDIAGLTVTWTAVSGVKYKTTARVRTQQSGTGGDQSLLLTDAAGTQIDADVVSVLANAVDERSLITRESGLSGSVTRKLRLSVSAGDVDVIAASGQAAFILVEAVGI